MTYGWQWVDGPQRNEAGSFPVKYDLSMSLWVMIYWSLIAFYSIFLPYSWVLLYIADCGEGPSELSWTRLIFYQWWYLAWSWSAATPPLYLSAFSCNSRLLWFALASLPSHTTGHKMFSFIGFASGLQWLAIYYHKHYYGLSQASTSISCSSNKESSCKGSYFKEACWRLN